MGFWDAESDYRQAFNDALMRATGKVQQGAGMFQQALGQAMGTVGQDAAFAAALLNEPRNAWIGLSPVGKAALPALKGLSGLGAMAGATVYHGSPHVFDAFKMSKIGTGEGAQAFGHGLYFAENPEVAKGYARVLPNKDFQRKVREVYDQYDHPDDAVAALGEAGLSPEQMNLVKHLQKDDWLGFDYPHQAVSAILSKDAKNWDPSPETLEAAKRLSNLYHVDLPDEAIDKMLDWDKPLSQQTQGVLTALKHAGITPSGRMLDKGANLYRDLIDYESHRIKAAGFPTTQEGVSQYLASIGVPGIKYLDRDSRTAGKGSYNYVVFDENLPKIQKRE